MQNHKRPPASLLFIFGGSGDLNYRKLSPALFNLFIDNWMPERFSIVGIGRTEYAGETYHDTCWMASNNSAAEKESKMVNGPISHSMLLTYRWMLKKKKNTRKLQKW